MAVTLSTPPGSKESNGSSCPGCLVSLLHLCACSCALLLISRGQFMINKISYILVCLMVSVSLVGCANYSGSHYSGSDARKMQSVQHGTVVSVNNVTIEDDHPSLIGALGGAVVGGILGNMLGGGTGRTLATMGGAAAGGLAGYGAGKGLATHKALEIGVKLDNGQQISVVQGADDMFSVGEKVRVLHNSDGSTRVSR